MNIKPLSLRAKWATKLVQAKEFVLVTDTDVVILADKVNFSSFNDIIRAQARLAALKRLRTQLNRAINKFDKELTGELDAKKSKTPARKIKVTSK